MVLAVAEEVSVVEVVLDRVAEVFRAVVVVVRDHRLGVRRRSVVRAAEAAELLLHDRLRRALGRVRERCRDRTLVVETSVAEMPARGISRTSEPARDRVLRRCRRIGRAMERGRALDQDKALRIAPEQVRALPLDRVLVRGKGSRIVRASQISRRGCRDSVRVVQVRVCRIKLPIGRRRSKVGKGT